MFTIWSWIQEVVIVFLSDSNPQALSLFIVQESIWIHPTSNVTSHAYLQQLTSLQSCSYFLSNPFTLSMLQFVGRSARAAQQLQWFLYVRRLHPLLCVRATSSRHVEWTSHNSNHDPCVFFLYQAAQIHINQHIEAHN